METLYTALLQKAAVEYKGKVRNRVFLYTPDLNESLNLAVFGTPLQVAMFLKFGFNLLCTHFGIQSKHNFNLFGK